MEDSRLASDHNERGTATHGGQTNSVLDSPCGTDSESVRHLEAEFVPSIVHAAPDLENLHDMEAKWETEYNWNISQRCNGGIRVAYATETLLDLLECCELERGSRGSSATDVGPVVH
jgi:hypothetical protein